MEKESTNEQELVKKCMSSLCRKAGFSDCGDLVQRDMEFLCESIETRTGTTISLSTMRRLMKGEFSRLPQIATLNALAIYLDYPSWHEFKLRHQLPSVPVQASVQKVRQTNSRRWFWPAAILLVIASFGLFALLKPGKQPAGNFEKATFAIHRTTTNDVPNTVVFNYDVEKVNADSFFIQQSWDRNRRVKIDKHDHTLTDIYYEPGYHLAKLIANDQVIKTIDVSIPTDRWFFYSKEKKPAAIPVYLQPDTSPSNGSLLITRQDVERAHVDLQKENQYVYLYFPSVFASTSDSYTLKCSIKVNTLHDEFCPYFICELFCQRNFMYFKSSPKGCASENIAQYGETITGGKTNDLSALSSNVSEWQNVEVSVKNRKVVVKLNEAEVFFASYDQPGGKITGLGFLSNGLCEVKDLTLVGADGQILYDHGWQMVHP